MPRRDSWLWWGAGITGVLALLSYRPKSAPTTPAKPSGGSSPPAVTYAVDLAGKVLLKSAADVEWSAPKLSSAAAARFWAMTKTWADLAEEASIDYRVPLAWIYAVMWAESQGDPKAKSSAGALGLMQVMPMHFKEGENPLDPRTNLRRGASLLQAARAKGPDIVQSASIYNAGTPPDGKGPWTNALWLAAGRKPSQTTRWGYAAEPGYLDTVVAANNTFVAGATSSQA